MQPVMTAIGLALATLAASGAAAQYGPAPSQQQPSQQPSATAAPAAQGRSVKVSKGAEKAIVELQSAVTANDTAAIPAKLAAAEAAAKNSNDRYVIAGLRLRAAVAAKSNSDIAGALEALLASGGIPEAETATLRLTLGETYLNLKQTDRAAAAFETVLAKDPNNAKALIALGETRVAQGRAADGVGLIGKAIAQVEATGAKPDEAWFKRALGIAYKARLPLALELSRGWIKAYPGPGSWRDALRVYNDLAELDSAGTLDVLRLSRAAGALEGDNEIRLYAVTALEKGFPGEAKAVLEEAAAAKKIDSNKEIFRPLIAQANAKSAGDRASLDASANSALAGAAARPAVATADALYSYGDYARAAELYRAALTKSGADAALINLHLGMALARQGDKAGATAALNAVTGPRAELAKYWLTYVALRG